MSDKAKEDAAKVQLVLQRIIENAYKQGYKKGFEAGVKATGVSDFCTKCGGLCGPSRCEASG